MDNSWRRRVVCGSARRLVPLDANTPLPGQESAGGLARCRCRPPAPTGSARRAREGDLDPAVLLAAGLRGVVGDRVLLAVTAHLVGDVRVAQLLSQDRLHGVGAPAGQDVA